MEFQVEIKNFGKLNHAKIKCRDITVFAGTNSTGKSYVSRTLYSIFSALAIDPHEHYYVNKNSVG